MKVLTFWTVLLVWSLPQAICAQQGNAPQEEMAAPLEIWEVDPDAVVRIGGRAATGPAELWTVVTAAIDESLERITVVNGGSSEVRVFDMSGRHLQSFGGEGQGPGEFAGIWEAFPAGQSVVVEEQARVQMLDRSGGVVRSFRHPRGPAGQWILLRGFLESGVGFGMFDMSPKVPPDGRYESVFWIVRIEPDGEAKKIDEVPGLIWEQRRRSNRPRPLLYGPQAEMAVVDGGFCVGYSAAYVIECFDTSGSLRTTVRRTAPADVPVTDQVLEWSWDQMELEADERAERLAVTPVAEIMPVFGRFIGDGGRLWVSELVPEEQIRQFDRVVPIEPTTWSVFDVETGVWLSDVEFPAGFRLLDAEGNFAVGVERDDLDVESVVVYRFGSDGS